MALSRPVLLALLGALLVGALFFATMGARQTADTPPAAKQAPAPAKAKKQSAQAGPTKAEGKRRTAASGAAQAEARAARTEAREPKAGARAGAAPSEGVPARVTSALARNHTVVLFFYQRGSADDDATARAVASLRGAKRVDVFSAPISRLADFRGVTGDAGVSQAPAVVILRGERVRLIEGFVDEATLAQELADVR